MLGPPMSIPTEQVMLCFSLCIQFPPGVGEGGSSDGGGEHHAAGKQRAGGGGAAILGTFLGSGVESLSRQTGVQVWAARTSSSNPELRRGTAL